MADLAEPVAHVKVQAAPSVHDSQEQPCLQTRTIEERGEDKPLESHEVVELQTFSERKAWIETKIKFLESLPPIDVFYGLKYLHTSAVEAPGLPTREELQATVLEHDTIEKETEVFDTGELKKLRQLTKAATQRNLSPADTDLIELTLTTIYELDKLLHLLRDRSDNFEMMSIRLTWEENRQASWRERRQLIEDLRTFVESRARWSSAIYDHSPKNQEPSGACPRRGSVASLASTGSTDSVINSPAFSRSARFKLAELLSRDAAQYTGRVTGLKHGMVNAAGKALDKLIDHSRKPVPDELLDEQDRLEEMCINDLEKIGKFTLSLVMQWRKADEIYVETMKDQLSAANLLEEIETAQMYHPTARQSASFASRIDTILKRLAVRADPASQTSLFPQPEHPLFPDQKEANISLVQKLSNDLSGANRLARKVEDTAKEYRARYEAVKRVEDLTQSVNDVLGSLTSINKKFQESTHGDDGDGTPPDLTTQDSLERTHHNVFLALLPSLLEETNTIVQRADELIRCAPSAVLGLDLPGIDQEFKESASASVQNLSSHRDETNHLRDSVVQRVARLREARRIASNIDSKFVLLKSARIEIARALDQHRWHQESGDASAPLTPESPLIDLTLSPISLPFDDQLARVNSSLESDVGEPLDKLSVSLEPELHFVLKQRYSNLHATVDASYQMLRLLGSIKEQTSAMFSVRDSFHKLSVEVEDSRIRCSSHIDVLLGSHFDNATDSTSEFNAENMDFIEKEVTLFLEGLTSQVPFVARHSRFMKRPSLVPPTSPILNSNGLVDIWSEMPFDLASVDAAVRADSNYYAMRISGNLEALLQTKTHLNLAQLARQLDNALSATVQDINALSQQFAVQKDIFNTLKRLCPETIGHLQAITNELDILRAKRSKTARSLSPVRDLLRQMEEISRPFSPTIRNLYDSRIHATDDAELRLHSWDDRMETLKHKIRLALDDEQRYQEHLRAAEAQRMLEDEKRQAAEEAERLRFEQEKQKEEERLRMLEMKRVEEELQEQGRRRISEELIEKERLQREAVEAELLRREEEERQAEVARIKSEQERIVKEETDRALREQERQEMVEKLRLAEEILETERKTHAENEKVARELAEKQEMEMGKLARRQAEMERSTLEAQERRQREEEERQKLRLDREAKERLAQTKRKGKEREARLPTIAQDAEDVFTTQSTSSRSPMPLPRHILELQSQVIRLRKRLRSIEINEAVHPTRPSTDLPTEEQFESMSNGFASVSNAMQKLPLQVDDVSTDLELQSLRTEVQESSRLLKGVEKLAQMQRAVQVCDGALSDLLEHIDSYPAPPLGTSSLHTSQPGTPPEEQLSARLAFTKQTVDDATSTLVDVIEDSRAISEHDRIQQTWSELNEMAGDRMVGKKSRSPSVVSGQSSGRNSSASSQSFQTHARSRKTASYANLSVSSITLPSRPKMLAPPQHTARRTLSGSRDTPTRSTSRLSTCSTISRAVSGPVRNMLHETTFASRQRTASLTNSNPTPFRLPTSLAPAIQIRNDNGRKRPTSPTTSDYQRSQSRSFNRAARAPSRASSNSSTWSRAPRNSLSSIMQRNVTPQKKPPQPPTRKKYVADPKSKLDVAVGDVVNKLPVGINVEGVTESWLDQSGKYWIGNNDPKLCFCRILRSQTVMVRVGGGWSELSKFIKNHFADSFRILPESPPRTGVLEAKWISSGTLLEAQGSPPAAPKTPEPTFPFLPTFALMTPSAQSPRSLKSSPSTKGSPLTPMQFLRKADSDLSLLRPVTPSKSPHRSRMPSNPNTPVWRP